MSEATCPNCRHNVLINFPYSFKCPKCEMIFVKAFLFPPKATDIQAEKQALKICVQALLLIAECGGSTLDEGLSCNGSWCSEQATQALRKAGVQ